MTIWLLLIKMYKGGPLIEIQNYQNANSYYLTPTVGLYNEDNYSFINSTLQCLLSIEQFVIYFLKKNYKIPN